jgi:type III secretory pathway lipoprotein EscJ
MKKLFLFLALISMLFALSGCNANVKENEIEEIDANSVIMCDRRYGVRISKITIENHDYYYTMFCSGGGVSLTHSENCKCKNK